MSCSGEMLRYGHRTPIAKAAYYGIIDTEARKRGDQTGLDTLVVHALNDGYSTSAIHCWCLSESIKYPTWEVRPQG